MLMDAAPPAPPDFDPEAMRPVIERTLQDIAGVLASDPEKAREALQALFGEERIQVTTDQSPKDFALAGTARLTLHSHGQSGARSDRLHTAGHSLVVNLHFSS